MNADEAEVQALLRAGYTVDTRVNYDKVQAVSIDIVKALIDSHVLDSIDATTGFCSIVLTLLSIAQKTIQRSGAGAVRNREFFAASLEAAAADLREFPLPKAHIQ